MSLCLPCLSRRVTSGRPPKFLNKCDYEARHIRQLLQTREKNECREETVPGKVEQKKILVIKRVYASSERSDALMPLTPVLHVALTKL
ncbi:hypothetical protein E2C01_038079 [Portunus trituberculatus]|uniref:Uncharacterized protein n=1 Tax=Portunus trituberculatus TaxID=210409 RepID=A0A5B7FGB1_PORTR|nr:hypothetical protein [Portunus trituberculatus]